MASGGVQANTDTPCACDSSKQPPAAEGSPLSLLPDSVSPVAWPVLLSHTEKNRIWNRESFLNIIQVVSYHYSAIINCTPLQHPQESEWTTCTDFSAGLIFHFDRRTTALFKFSAAWALSYPLEVKHRVSCDFTSIKVRLSFCRCSIPHLHHLQTLLPPAAAVTGTGAF